MPIISGGSSGGGSGTVTSVTATDTSIVVSGTAVAPTIATATLDVVAAQHPPVAAVPMNTQKHTGLAPGLASGESVCYEQLPTQGGLVASYRTTTVTVSNTVAETDLLGGAVTIAAGLMGTTGCIRLSLWGDCKQASGGNAGTYRFKLKLGGTILIDTGVVVAGTATGASRFPWRIQAHIYNLDAANSQSILFSGSAVINTAVGTNIAFSTGEGQVVILANGGATGIAAYEGFNTAAVNTAVGNTLVLTVINPSATTTDCVCKGALVEVV